MKILQILKDCVTAAVKKDKLLFSNENGYILMSPDGLVMYKLPQAKVPLTFSYSPSDLAEKVWESCEQSGGYEKVTRRYIVEEEKPRCNLIILNDRVAIDKRLLKNFEPRSQLMIGEKSYNPVRVYEDEQMVGLVMPIRWEGKEQTNAG